MPCKTSTGPKASRIRFDKIDGFIRVLDGQIKHLVLFDYGLFHKICDKIKYLISEKVVLQIVLIIILEKSEFIHKILYLGQTKNMLVCTHPTGSTRNVWVKKCF